MMWGSLAACAAVGYCRRPLPARRAPSGSGRLTIGRSLPSCPTRAPDRSDSLGVSPHMVETIEWTPRGVVMIDQTRLPLHEEYVTCRNYQRSEERRVGKECRSR